MDIPSLDATSFPIFVRYLQGCSLCLIVCSLYPNSWIQTLIHNSTGLPLDLQNLVYVAKRLQARLFLKDCGFTRDFSPFLAYHPYGIVIGYVGPPHSHPHSFKEATKYRSSSLGPKSLLGLAFIVEQSKYISMLEVDDPHVYGYATLYKQRTIIYIFNGLDPQQSHFVIG